MSSVDTAWLRMDRTSNLMVICGVLIFRERLALGHLRATIAERFLRFKRFRQRAVQTAGGAYWQVYGGFDIADHVRRIALEGRAGKAELQTLVSELVATPLDPARPMWQFHLIDRYEGGSALIMRVHHCYADGIALIQVMLSMTDTGRAATAAGPVPSSRRQEASVDDPAAELADPIAGALKFAMKTGSTLIEKGVA